MQKTSLYSKETVVERAENWVLIDGHQLLLILTLLVRLLLWLLSATAVVSYSACVVSVELFIGDRHKRDFLCGLSGTLHRNSSASVCPVRQLQS